MVLADLFLLRDEPYRHACESPRAPLWISGILIATGCLYGALVATFQRAVGGEIQGFPLSDVPNWILYAGNMIPGMLIAVVVHAGITIVVWLMVKGASGRGQAVFLYRATAYLLPLGVPALPLIAATTVAGASDGVPLPLEVAYAPLAGLGLCLFVIGLFKAIRVVEGLSLVRSALAVALFSLFSFSLLLII